MEVALYTEKSSVIKLTQEHQKKRKLVISSYYINLRDIFENSLRVEAVYAPFKARGINPFKPNCGQDSLGRSFAACLLQQEERM